jgi:hypothetical protein
MVNLYVQQMFKNDEQHYKRNVIYGVKLIATSSTAILC